MLALAPDAGSVSAAAKLVGSVSADGCDDGAVWGLCAGSGKTPYQTVVDLTGPAYKCSCPSRKFPCKHALALLLRWSAGDVPVAERADFTTTWLEGRAAKKETPAPAERTPDPAAAAKRSERRAERVGTGLGELDVWLTDQVRTGLAGAAQAGYAYGAATAARMVDAQAPGVASALRRLPRAVVSGEGWTGRLLTDLALLRLLVAAHARLEDLTEDEAAVVRAHVGYPVRAEDVLASEPLRDHWAVTGVRDVVADNLTARRVWLRGRRTGHAALVLTFTPSGQSPDTSLPAGTVVDADLHFHPGTPELRAVVGTRYAAPVALTDLAPGSARDAVGEFQRAVSLDPWTRHWPVVVSGLVPVAVPAAAGPGFALTGPDGTLPVDVGGADVWRLLAVSGGHPVTVAGELGDRGLRPTGVLGGGPGDRRWVTL
ncbi:SWIM zinc finger protein [Kineococcus rhizosphaerae]|uniref:SWIM zinc finger protein n=1 Tax=Kineococcus rhizosphaerae TaxID=559628 RepID=A0A2T0R4X9_9ACTN|nr:SWIM zinc finger protein [Kineococcus rhizosphaerae]